MAMAHGYYRVAGKPAAVMVHVTVGTGNAINGLMNAARDNVPMLLAAGRTPLTETGHIASRNRSIHWGQEAFDQGGMVREFVKWDYELRAGQPVDAVVDRALDIAMSEPRGPVYLTLPREVLASPAVAARRDTVRPLGSSAPAPSSRAIEEAASLIAKAEFPLIVTSSAGRSREAFDELAALAEEFALPVVQNEARDFNLPSNHPMNLGFAAAPFLPKADVVLVLEASCRGFRAPSRRKRDAKIIHISTDPLAKRYPFRDIEADLLITGEAACGAGEPARGPARRRRPTAAVESRRKIVAAAREDMEAKRRKLARDGAQRGADPLRLARGLPQRGEVRGRHRGQRARRADRPARPDHARQLHGQPARRRARLRPRRGARRQARGARARGDRRGRRRLLHVRQSAALSLCRARREPADADHHRQQPFLARGAPVDARRLSRTATPPRPTSCRSPS